MSQKSISSKQTSFKHEWETSDGFSRSYKNKKSKKKGSRKLKKDSVRKIQNAKRIRLSKKKESTKYIRIQNLDNAVG